MVRYTGNPYVDAGVAVLELRLHKPCEQFTKEDLEVQACQLEAEYKKPIWKSYLRIHFFNCAWTQADITSEKSKVYIQNVLRGYTLEPLQPARACFFCSRTATIIADRSHVPLIASQTNMSSGSQGIPGLPVCGFCVFSIHFYPLGTIKIQEGRQPGRPLFWWTSDPFWTRKLTQRFHSIVERFLAQTPEEFINLPWPSTQLLRNARESMQDWEVLSVANRPPLCDLIGIYASSSGFRPEYDELRIPRTLLEFWSEAGTLQLYRQIEHDAWESNETKSDKPSLKSKSVINKKWALVSVDLARRNRLYESLGEAFRNVDFTRQAKKIAIQFFLSRQGKKVVLGSVQLAELFLEKVGGMQKERLNAIREIADTIATSVNSKRLIDRLMRTKKALGDYLSSLRVIQRELSSTKKPLQWEKVLLALDLSTDDDANSGDIWLVSELILIRIFEKLAVEQPGLLSEITEPE